MFDRVARLGLQHVPSVKCQGSMRVCWFASSVSFADGSRIEALRRDGEKCRRSCRQSKLVGAPAWWSGEEMRSDRIGFGRLSDAEMESSSSIICYGILLGCAPAAITDKESGYGTIGEVNQSVSFHVPGQKVLGLLLQCTICWLLGLPSLVIIT